MAKMKTHQVFLSSYELCRDRDRADLITSMGDQFGGITIAETGQHITTETCNEVIDAAKVTGDPAPSLARFSRAQTMKDSK